MNQHNPITPSLAEKLGRFLDEIEDIQLRLARNRELVASILNEYAISQVMSNVPMHLLGHLPPQIRSFLSGVQVPESAQMRRRLPAAPGLFSPEDVQEIEAVKPKKRRAYKYVGGNKGGSPIQQNTLEASQRVLNFARAQGGTFHMTACRNATGPYTNPAQFYTIINYLKKQGFVKDTKENFTKELTALGERKNMLESEPVAPPEVPVEQPTTRENPSVVQTHYAPKGQLGERILTFAKEQYPTESVSYTEFNEWHLKTFGEESNRNSFYGAVTRLGKKTLKKVEPGVWELTKTGAAAAATA